MSDTKVWDALRENMRERGISRDSDYGDKSLGVVRSDVVPVRGSVHLATGRIASRSDVDKELRKKRLF